MRLVFLFSLCVVVHADDDVQVEDIDELEISDEDLPFDENDGFDIDNFDDEANDPTKLDPNFKPDDTDPRNIIFNNYDDWTLQANVDKMINETFRLHLVSIKDLANPMTMQQKLPSMETIYYSTRVKFMTGYDRWLGLEKLVTCKRLADVNPKSAPIKTLYHGFWSVVNTYQKFDSCSFNISRGIEAGIRKRVTDDEIRMSLDKFDTEFCMLVDMLAYLDTTQWWVAPTNMMADVVNAFVAFDDVSEILPNSKFELVDIASMIKAYFSSPLSNVVEVKPADVETYLMEQITCKRGECWFVDMPTTQAVLEAAHLIHEKAKHAVLDKETLKKMGKYARTRFIIAQADALPTEKRKLEAVIKARYHIIMTFVFLLKLDKDSCFDDFDNDDLALPANKVSLTMDKYLPDKFAKLVGKTFVDKEELKQLHQDYYTKKFNFVDRGKGSIQEVMTAEEKKSEMEAILFKSGLDDEFKLDDFEFQDDIDAQVENQAERVDIKDEL